VPVRFSRIPLLLAMTTLFVVAAVWAQAPKKEWKDGRVEYDLYDAALKQTDPAKRLELLNTWQSKYPNSDYKVDRLGLFLGTYQGLKQFDKAVETGNEILATEPKNAQALLVMVASAPLLSKPTPELLGMVEKAARTLAGSINELKPANVAQAEWDKGKPPIEAMAHNTLGSIAQQRKDYVTAEKEYTTSLQAVPENGAVSYSLGTVILLQKNPDTQSAALYHIARAASYTGPGALPDAGRKEVEKYLTSTYTKFHGSAEGLDELRKTASTQVLPPQGFKIHSGAEIQAGKDEEFKKTNPMLALWMTVKSELTADNGPAYFESSVKGALLPGGAGGVTKFKGKLVSMTPPKAPKQLVLGITDASTAEVTLNLDEPLAGVAPVGTELEFEGVASSFTAEPFKVIFDADKEKLAGWPVAAAPGAKKGGPGVKKALPPAAKKK
jgi:tetratricopeptide (TPR) repeat protein